MESVEKGPVHWPAQSQKASLDLSFFPATVSHAQKAAKDLIYLIIINVGLFITFRLR